MIGLQVDENLNNIGLVRRKFLNEYIFPHRTMTDEGKSNATTSLTTDRAVAVEEILLGHNNKAKSEAKEFRNYDMDTIEPRVLHHYRDMRTYQTVDFYRRMAAKYSFENGMYRRLMTIDEALAELEHYVVRSSYSQSVNNGTRRHSRTGTRRCRCCCMVSA